jgi:putative ABC transport system ATP-binding protein
MNTDWQDQTVCLICPNDLIITRSPITINTTIMDNNNTDARKVVIQLDNVKREFLVGDEVVHALRGVSFKIYEGEFVTIMGKSGSGKSTLLNQLGCLDTPTSGEYYLDGVSVRTMSRSDRAVLRNRKIGFIFQNYNLLAKTTSIENVELPLMYNPDVTASERRERAVEALQAVGLGDRLYHKSNQMSGGQMQRVAIARALVNNPAVILADEATGNLDTRTSFEILVLFQKLHAEGRTIIFVTHNPDIARYSSRNIQLRDGHIIADEVNPNIQNAAEGLAALPANSDE